MKRLRLSIPQELPDLKTHPPDQAVFPAVAGWKITVDPALDLIVFGPDPDGFGDGQGGVGVNLDVTLKGKYFFFSPGRDGHDQQETTPPQQQNETQQVYPFPSVSHNTPLARG
jgi:hypothetical protein